MHAQKGRGWLSTLFTPTDPPFIYYLLFIYIYLADNDTIAAN